MKTLGATVAAAAALTAAEAYPGGGLWGNEAGRAMGGTMHSSAMGSSMSSMAGGSSMGSYERTGTSMMGGASGSERYISTMPLRSDAIHGGGYNNMHRARVGYGRRLSTDAGKALHSPAMLSPAMTSLALQSPSELCVTGGCSPSAIRNPHVVVDRQEIARIVKERSCPSGMTLEGDQCVGEDVCPANFVCPSGTVARGERCVTTAKPLAECPFGFDMTAAGRCQTCDITPAEFVCHDPAAALDHTGTACSKSVEVAPYCPPGYKMDGSAQCVQTLPAQPQCAPGYTMSRDSVCVRTLSHPATPVCPDGATLVGNKCSIVRQDPPRCPPGYGFDAKLGTCAQPAQKIPAACPQGMHRVGSNCEKCDRFPAEAFCPSADYTLDFNNQCVKEIPIPPRCPPGHKFSSFDSTTCERVVAQLPVCPDGQRLVGGNRCENVVEHPSIECCPPGFELLDGRCRRVEELAPKLTCENECYKVTTTRVAYACPDDAEFADHPVAPQCVRKAAVAEYCPSMPAAYRRCMADQKEGRSLQGCPSTQAIRTAASACPPPPAPEKLPAQAFCPEGGVLEGNRCVLREPIIPERKCPVGTLDEFTGQCVRETFVPVKSDCPPGTTRRGSACVTVEHNAAAFICPDGSERNAAGVCVVVEAAIASAPRVSRTPAAYRCASGVLTGRECAETARTPMELVCPPGTVEGGVAGCVKTAELIVPPPVEKFVRPSYVCAAGSTLAGQDCTSVDRVPADKVCPAGTVMDYSGACARHVEAIVTPPRVTASAARPVCPPGLQVRGNNCFAHRTAEVLRTCPAGMQMENGQCVREHEKQAVCPAGTELAFDACVRRISVPATVKIVQGCAHDVVSACDTCPREVKSTCAAAH